MYFFYNTVARISYVNIPRAINRYTIWRNESGA